MRDALRRAARWIPAFGRCATALWGEGWGADGAGGADGGLRARGHCLVEGGLAALGAPDPLVHGGVLRDLEGVVGEEVSDGAELELGVVALPDVGDGTAYCPIRPTNVYDRQNHL